MPKSNITDQIRGRLNRDYVYVGRRTPEILGSAILPFVVTVSFLDAVRHKE